MKEKLTLNEYIQKIKELVPNSKLRQEEYGKAYAEYCKLEGRRTPDVLRVDLIRMPFFMENQNVKGYFSQFWLRLSDLNRYLLKELPSGRFFSDSLGFCTRDNALVVPRIVKGAGLDAAEYYLANWVMDDSVSTWEDEFLLTPSFLKDGDEMLSLRDIFGQECLDIELVENKLVRELQLRHFKKKNIDRLVQELRREICMSEIIDNTDISSENMSIIINSGVVRMAPLYDFDFCMGNEAVNKKHFKVNGKEGLAPVLEYYKDDENLIKWLREKVLTIDIDKAVSIKVSSPNRWLVGKKSKYMYKDFWKQQMEIVKAFIDHTQNVKLEDREIS